MTAIKRKIAFLLIFVMILSNIYVPDNHVYAATDIQLKTTLNNFDANDNLKSANQTTAKGATSTFNDIHISTPIKIELLRTPASNLKVDAGGNLSSFVTLTENGDTTNTNLIGSSANSILNDNAFTPNNFASVINLSPNTNKSLKPDTTYTLKIDTTKIVNQADDSPVDNPGIYTLTLNTEKTPKATITAKDNKIILEFDRKIDTTKIDSTTLNNNNIFFKDESLGISAPDLNLGQVASSGDTSIVATPNQTNSKKSIVTINGIKNATYTVTLNKTLNPQTPQKTFVRQAIPTGTMTSPDMSSMTLASLPIAEIVKNDVKVNFTQQNISKNIRVKSSANSTMSNITLANAQSTSNANIDVDAMIDGGKLYIDLDVSATKKLIQQPLDYTGLSNNPNSPVTISDGTNVLNLSIKQIKSNPTGELDTIEITDTTNNPLNPNTKYTVTIHKDKFYYNGDSTMPAGSATDKEVYTFTTEPAPEFTNLTPITIRQDATDRKITLTSSRPIEQMAVGDLKNHISVMNGVNSVIDTATLVNDTTLEITLKDLSNSLGDTTVNIPLNTFKRKGSKNLSAKLFNGSFKITRQEDYLKIQNLLVENYSDNDTKQNAPNQENLLTVASSSNTPSSTINNVYIGTPIEITLNTNVKADVGKNIVDIVKLSEGANSLNLTEYYTVAEPLAPNTSFDKIKLTPIKALKENAQYTLSIDNSQMLDAIHSISLGNTKFNIILNTEKKPTGTQASEVNKTYTVKFDRKLDTVTNVNVELFHFVPSPFGGSYQPYPTPITLNFGADNKTIDITGLPKGLYKIKLNNIKRAGSTDAISTLNAEEFVGAVTDDTQPDFEIKSLSDKVSQYISLIKADTNQAVNVNKKGETNTNNTNINVDTEIKVKFDIPYEYADADAFILKKDGTSSKLRTTITNYPVPGVIEGVTITADKSLEPNTKYILTLDKSKFTDRQGSLAGVAGDIEEYEFTTELAPELTLDTTNLEKGQEPKLIIKSSRNIEQASADDLKTLITVKDKANSPINIISATLTNKNMLTVVLDDISPSTVALGDATINIKPDVFKRDGSKSLNAKALNGTFTISRANDHLKADLTTSVFSATDRLESSLKRNISVTQPLTIDNLYVGSDILIKLNDSVKTDKTIQDIVKFSENTTNLDIDDYFTINVQNNINTGFDTITLTLKQALKPDSSYTLTLDNSHLKESSYNTPIGTTKFTFVLNTEKSPVGTQGNEVNKVYSVTFDRRIDRPAKNDIKLFQLNEYGQFVEFNNFADSDIKLENDNRTLLIENLKYGKYKIQLNLNEDKAKRITETGITYPVYAKTFIGSVADESKADFEIKNLASTVSDYIQLKKYIPTGSQTVQVNKTGDNGTNNTEIETNTNINVKFTIPYAYSTNSFAIVPASNTTAPSLTIKSISRITSSSGATDGVNIVLNDNLAPDTKYKLILNKDTFINSQNSTAGNAGEKEEYEFTTESSPKLALADVPKVEQRGVDQTILLRFDKNIEIKDASKITIDGTTAFSSITASENSLSLSVKSALATTLSIGNHTINIAPQALIRTGSTNVYVRELTTPLSVIEDQIKKAEEDAKKKAEEDKKKQQEDQIKSAQLEREAYRTAVANALSNEMQARYQAEYGTDYDFKSFNDYIKDKYIKEKGTLYDGTDYIQAYLKDYGYVDDFISKYGRNSKDINSYANDYLNRYGSFAYSDREKYDNPFFMNPFRDSSNKRGYYDYYNKYDYGYKYPEMRVGDDNISQANLEKEQQLKQKEAELIAKERGYNIKTAQNYTSTGVNAPTIIITQGSRYFTQEDEFGNRTTVDMGVAPVVSNGRMFVAVTPLANKLGLWVQYDNNAKTATLSKPGTTSAITPNSSYITINGKSENMGIRPIVQNGKMMIPVHYLAKAFGLDSSKVVMNSNTITINNY